VAQQVLENTFKIRLGIQDYGRLLEIERYGGAALDEVAFQRLHNLVENILETQIRFCDSDIFLDAQRVHELVHRLAQVCRRVLQLFEDHTIVVDRTVGREERQQRLNVSYRRPKLMRDDLCKFIEL